MYITQGIGIPKQTNSWAGLTAWISLEVFDSWDVDANVGP